ncbi:MAG: PH domain-containing protein [Actinomycetota bacterium]|nr:PH domain-containing protein [Actinomycetota bacterium]
MTAFDPSMMNPHSQVVLWEGASSDLTNVATAGRIKAASYQVTEDAVRFASGIISNRQEAVPLWAVRDVDLAQSMAQRARGVADLTLKLDPAAGVYGQAVLTLKAIKDAKSVRDLILRQANVVRDYFNRRRHEMEVERNRAGASHIYAPPPPPQAPPPQPASGGDVMAQLTKLGEKRQAGLLTDEEFTAAKARLLA